MTRALLIEAAEELVLADGIPQTRIEDVCARAGFTRGAFYSNFNSLEELYTAVMERRTNALSALLATALAETDVMIAANRPVGEVVDDILTAVPMSSGYLALHSDFVALALRSPHANQQLARYRDIQVERLQPPLMRALTAAGRRLTVSPRDFTQTVIAAHESAYIYHAGEPRNTLAMRTLMMNSLVRGLSTEAAA